MKFALKSIVNLYLNIVTLESRGNPNQDFHELGVDSLRDVLSAAYYAGYAAAFRVRRGSATEELPTELHTVRGDEWLHAGIATAADGPDAETVTTAPIPEIALLRHPWREDVATDLLDSARVGAAALGSVASDRRLRL